MRYLVRARVRPNRHEALLEAIDRRMLGRGSVAEGEYLRNMAEARVLADGSVKWVEVCYCATPLDEERPYWSAYFELERIKDAHRRSECRHEDGSQPWSCDDCDCTTRLTAKLANQGEPFVESLRRRAKRYSDTR